MAADGCGLVARPFAQPFAQRSAKNAPTLPPTAAISRITHSHMRELVLAWSICWVDIASRAVGGLP
jgi:hypothetical protein